MELTSPQFVGNLNFATDDPSTPKLRQLEEPFGLLYKHYFLVVLPWYKMNGASIPRFLWWLLGSPFGAKNKRWMPFHDGGYNGFCRVVDMNEHSTWKPEDILECLVVLEDDFFINHLLLSRGWWDEMCRDGAMVAAKCWKWKRKMVYSGVNSFGWYSWNKHRCSKKVKTYSDIIKGGE